MSTLNAVVGKMTRLDGPVFESRQVQGLFFLSCEPSKQDFRSTQWVPVVFFEERCWPVNLTTQTHLLPGLRTSGATYLLPPHVFMVWRGTDCLANKEM